MNYEDMERWDVICGFAMLVALVVYMLVVDGRKGGGA